MSAPSGRPRDTRLDAKIIDAIESVLLGSGYDALTIDGVAREAETTRAAVYRRHRNRGSMVVGLLVERFGVDPAPDTGQLHGDLQELQRLQVRFFSHPVIVAALAGALSDASGDPMIASEIHDLFIAPRRASVAELLRRAAGRGEIVNRVQPAIVSDLLTGPLLLHACMPALGPLSDELIAATVQSALAILGATTIETTR
jgi:AcrR family transcriptional regulator